MKKPQEELKKSDFKVETEALVYEAQEQALETNYINCNIEKIKDSQVCRLCGKSVENISHIVNKCMMLAQKEYKQKLDNVVRLVHWKLCGNYSINKKEK